jgi:hypothetical protein
MPPIHNFQQPMYVPAADADATTKYLPNTAESPTPTAK